MFTNTDKLVELYNQGHTVRAISHMVRCHHKTVSKYLKLAGITITNKGNKGTQKSLPKMNWDTKKERDNLVIQLYTGGTGSPSIAKMLGIGKRTVLKILDKNNVARDNYYEVQKDKLVNKHQDIVKEYESGQSLESIAVNYDVRDGVISEILGDKVRTPGQTMSGVLGQENKIISMYDQGMSCYEIADELDISNPDNIWKFLRKSKKIRDKHEVRKLVAEKLSNKSSFKSRPQKLVEEILRELGYEFEPEFAIEGWNFDIKVKDLLIEVQGSYWHKLPGRINRDQKKNKIAKDNGYKVLYIWDTQINKSIEFVKDLLLYHLDKQLVDFSFNDVDISIDFEKSSELMEYHYAGSMGRNKYPFVAFLNGNPIASCVFSAPIRQETAEKQNVKFDEMLELSRFVIHPKYHKRNFATWLISRCVKKLKKMYNNLKCIVSFSDLTYNHHGGIYRALGWRFDGTVASDYWYVNNKRNILHKKSIWNKAKRMGFSEKEYAEKHQLKKVFGMSKNRYIFKL